MYNVDYFVNLVGNSKKKIVLSCAAPYDAPTIEAIETFRKKGLLDAILVGNKTKINDAILLANANIEDYDIVEADELVDIAQRAVSLISEGKADVLMKALIDTSVILKEFLKKEHDLRKSKVLSHVAVYFKEDYEKLLIITDAGMNLYPNVDEKRYIIENAVEVAHALGIKVPNVAMLCAKEKLYEKMPPTVDAAKLQEMNQNGEITGCVVSGPLQLDNAISKEAAELKGLSDPVAGNADIFIAPNIETGNVFAKSLTYLAGFSNGGLIVGGKIPVVLTSRVDGYEEKVSSIALAILSVNK